MLMNAPMEKYRIESYEKPVMFGQTLNTAQDNKKVKKLFGVFNNKICNIGVRTITTIKSLTNHNGAFCGYDKFPIPENAPS